jgi:NitT/TauT family transport system permease protein
MTTSSRAIATEIDRPAPTRNTVRTRRARRSPGLFSPRDPVSRSAYLLANALTVAIVFAGWCWLTYGGYVRSDFLPAPHMVLTAAWKMAVKGTLFYDAAASVYVIFAGFLLASLLAIPLGILVGTFKIVEGLSEPIINFVRYLPVSALIPLFILWIGIGTEEKIMVVFVGTFFQQVILIADVSANVSRDLIDVSYTLGSKRRNVLWNILVPASLPGIMDTLRITMGWAWTYLVVAELVAANKGLGYMILTSMRGLFTDRIFVGILVIGLLGLLTDKAFKMLHIWLFPWSTKSA